MTKKSIAVIGVGKLGMTVIPSYIRTELTLLQEENKLLKEQLRWRSVEELKVKEKAYDALLIDKDKSGHPYDTWRVTGNGSVDFLKRNYTHWLPIPRKKGE